MNGQLPLESTNDLNSTQELTAEQVVSKYTINVRKLSMKDWDAIESNGGTTPTKMKISVLARVTETSEEEMWNLDIESYALLSIALDQAMSNLIKKMNAGNS
jgi:hypothetical protein